MKCIASTNWLESRQSIPQGIVMVLMLVLAAAAGTSRAQSLGITFPNHQVFSAVRTIPGDAFQFSDTYLGNALPNAIADHRRDRPLIPRELAALTDPVSDTSDASREAVKQPVIGANPPLNRDSGCDCYYKNRLDFSMDGGWLPINIPFVFDVFLGDGYNMTPLRYTLVPLIASLRWQVDNVAGPWIFRGNWDVTASGAVTLIPKGPETRYYAWIMGIRRNFVPRRGKISPYFDGRLGLGNIDAKEPLGVLYAQGQDFTFTVNLGSGLRYNFNPRYSISAGLNWMHISNLYLSEPKFSNYGINVYGPMFGINVRLGKSRHNGSY